MSGFRKILRALFERRVRGFRVIELIGCLCLAVLVLGVYAFKAGAGAEGAQINDAARQIAAEQRRVRALKAELAHLEAPDRLERLATQYLGMAPVAAKKESDPEAVAALPQSNSVPTTSTQSSPASSVAIQAPSPGVAAPAPGSLAPGSLAPGSLAPGSAASQPPLLQGALPASPTAAPGQPQARAGRPTR